MDQNLRDLIALQQLQATQKLAQQTSPPTGPKCPHCGGVPETNFDRCKNCAGQLSWVKGLPCKPGEEKSFEMQVKFFEEQTAERYRKHLAANNKIGWFSAITGVIVAVGLVIYSNSIPLVALVSGIIAGLIVNACGKSEWRG